MNELAKPPGQPATVGRQDEIADSLSRIEKRDWWIWGYTVFVILLLTGAILSLALPSIYQGAEALFSIKLREAVYGLAALVVLFNVYAIYQQVLIKRLRRQLAEKQGHSEVLRTLAMVDPLTGLYNRRFAEQRLAAEVARSSRKGHPLTVMLLDLDSFKEINDTHGHAAGDMVLQEFASRLNKAIRGSDLAVRLGGDEFLVVLPECQLDQLHHVLDRVKSVTVSWQGQQIPVTFSAGWKTYESGERPEDMLAAADRALYDNKRARHQQALANPPSSA